MIRWWSWWSWGWLSSERSRLSSFAVIGGDVSSDRDWDRDHDHDEHDAPHHHHPPPHPHHNRLRRRGMRTECNLHSNGIETNLWITSSHPASPLSNWVCQKTLRKYHILILYIYDEVTTKISPSKTSQNNGISKIGLTPHPHPIHPIPALWRIWRQKCVHATHDALTTKVSKLMYFGMQIYFLEHFN